MSMDDWAKREVELACKRENPDRKEGEFDYGCACYESALKAYRSLSEDGHSGLSFSFTKNILIRLMNGLPLTLIREEDFFPEDGNTISEDPEWLKKNGLKSSIQCPRMSSLFRDEFLDGTVKYRDVERSYCFDPQDPKYTYYFGFLYKFVDEMFPITMPYMPVAGKYRVETSEWLAENKGKPEKEKKTGMFDTVALWAIHTPDGDRIPINRFWEEENGDFVEINYEEWLDRGGYDGNRKTLTPGE